MLDLMKDALRLVGVGFVVATTIVCSAYVAKAEVIKNDCTYQRMKAAYAFAALDDAERENLPQAVRVALASDLQVETYQQRVICAERRK